MVEMPSKKTINENLTNASNALEEARTEMFAASQTAMQSDENDLSLVEHLFEVIKKTELLRRDVRNIIEDSIILVKASQPNDDPKTRDRTQVESTKYFLRGDTIVKLGVSKNGKTYEHAVHRPDFDKIISRLNEFADGRQFSVDELHKGIELPTYLTYLVVALLREHTGDLESPKRGLYKFRKAEPLIPQTIIDKI